MSDHNDGLQNVVSKIGTQKDRTSKANMSFSADRVFNKDELADFYRDENYAARMVDLLPNEATRKGFTISIPDDQELQELIRWNFKRLNIYNKLALADRWSCLFGGGALILGIDDGLPLSEPVDVEKIKALDFAIVVDRYSLAAHTLESDPASPWGYGKPQAYRYQPSFNTSDSDRLKTGDLIHASRMIRFFGVTLPDTQAAENEYWGDSILQRSSQSIHNMIAADANIGNVVQTFSQTIFKKKGLAAIMQSADGETQLHNMFDTMNNSLSILGMYVVGEGDDFMRLQAPVSGLDQIYDRIAQSYCAAIEAPATKVFGTPPPGISTDDASGQRNWAAIVTSHQTEKYIPAIEYIVEIMLAAEKKIDVDASVSANPLEDLNEEQEAATFKTYADALALLIDRGVITPNEARQSLFATGERFRPQSFSLDTQTPFSAPEPPDDDSDESMITIDSAEANAASGFNAVNFIAPDSVRKAAAEGLDLRRKYGRGGSASGLVRAQALASGRPMTIDQIRTIKANLDAAEPFATVTPDRGAGKINWLLNGGAAAKQWAATVITHVDSRKSKQDANTDPHEKRSARRKVQTEIEAGRLRPASDFKCKVCKKNQATEYDHVAGYDGSDETKLKVEPLCASCHHKRTNARKEK